MKVDADVREEVCVAVFTSVHCMDSEAKEISISYIRIVCSSFASDISSLIFGISFFLSLSAGSRFLLAFELFFLAYMAPMTAASRGFTFFIDIY
jgi:hypothetical protein